MDKKSEQLIRLVKMCGENQFLGAELAATLYAEREPQQESVFEMRGAAVTLSVKFESINKTFPT